MAKEKPVKINPNYVKSIELVDGRVFRLMKVRFINGWNPDVIETEFLFVSPDEQTMLMSKERIFSKRGNTLCLNEKDINEFDMDLYSDRKIISKEFVE